MDVKKIKEWTRDIMLSITFLVAVVFFGLIWLESETPMEDFTVTIDCRYVIMNPVQFPDIVLKECRDKVRFIMPRPENMI